MALKRLPHPTRLAARWEDGDRVYVLLEEGGLISQLIPDVCAQIMAVLDDPGSATEHRAALLRAMAGEENWLAALEIHRQARFALG